MTMTLKELSAANQALHRLGSQPVGVKTAYALKRLMKLVQDELAVYIEQREELFKEFGVERDPTAAEHAEGMRGKVREVPSDKFEAFTAKAKELDAIPVTIDKWLLTLELLAEFKVSGGDLLALGALVVEE